MIRLTERYFQQFLRAVLPANADDEELALSELSAVGRELVRCNAPLEEVTEIHDSAIRRLAASHPELRLADVSDRLSIPLLEAYMAYSLAFREQIDARDRMQARVEESRKLEAIGTLAAGIAHDFNTILGTIVGFAELTADFMDEGSIERSNLEQILTASFRARDLIARILTFSRQQSQELCETNLLASIGEAIDMLKASLDPRIRLTLEITIEEASVMAAPTQLQQVIMNLCINAADAIAGHGHIWVNIEAIADPHPTPDGSRWVQVRVRDDGCGIPQAMQQRIFDPFFTTKDVGKGTGLGLSMVYGIVKHVGGLIELDSEPGKGTEFRIMLPLLPAAETTKTDPNSQLA